MLNPKNGGLSMGRSLAGGLPRDRAAYFKVGGGGGLTRLWGRVGFDSLTQNICIFSD